MAAAPAYRYDHMAEPVRHGAPTPSVRVVPGHKHTANPALSDMAVTGIKVFIACLLAFLLIGFIRVSLASAAYGVASASSDLRAEVADARSAGESLAVQESLLSSPSNIRSSASDLGMSAASTSTTITLAADPVALDSAGNLSFAGSVARLVS